MRSIQKSLWMSFVLLLIVSVSPGFVKGADARERIPKDIIFTQWSGTYGTPADIYAIAEDGTDRRQLTSNGFYSEMTPSWSPDGTRIAYVSRSDIFIADADGSNPSRITRGRATEWFPTWSPDGQRVAFHSMDWDTYESYIFSVRTDGTGMRQITRLGRDWSPAWSPDGEWLAFVSFENETDTRHLYLTRSDGSRLIRLTHGTLDAFAPSWSPDGRSIAFEGWKKRDSTVRTDDIFVIELEGREIRRLTSGLEYDASACWSPDGTKIAFSRAIAAAAPWVWTPAGGVGWWVESQTDLYLINPDGSGLKQLTDTPHLIETYCSWGS